jgi:hypothetical protein
MQSRMIKAGLILVALIFMSWQVQIAIAQDQQPAPRDKVKGQDMQSPRHRGEQPPESGSDLAGLYAELRDLGKQYKEARSEDAKQHIQQRAEELMSQVFDAKVQKEQHRIDGEERRLNTEKELLHEKQMHKQDLVHQGVQRFFETGEPPEWATSREE